MEYNNLFSNKSLKFIHDFIGKIAYQGFGARPNNIMDQQVVLLVSILVAVFLLYKLAWLVW